MYSAVPRFLDQQDVGVGGLEEGVEECTLSVDVNRDDLERLCNHSDGVGVTWMGRRPETTSTTKLEYSA